MLGRVVGKADVGPVEVGALDARRHDLTHGQAVADLLQDEAGEHGEDLQLDAVAELVRAVEQGRIGEAVVLLVRAQHFRAVGDVGRCAAGAIVALTWCAPVSLTITPPPWLSRVTRKVVKNVWSRLAW